LRSLNATTARLADERLSETTPAGPLTGNPLHCPGRGRCLSLNFALTVVEKATSTWHT
jgi:hypothetical protein